MIRRAALIEDELDAAGFFEAISLTGKKCQQHFSLLTDEAYEAPGLSGFLSLQISLTHNDSPDRHIFHAGICFRHGERFRVEDS
jgi:hypothetical protein